MGSRLSIKLPLAGGSLTDYSFSGASGFTAPSGSKPLLRSAYAAAHVVCDPLADVDPLHQSAIDWEGTLAYRRYLWSLGLGVAEAMDTAQRGMGLDWESSRELIRRSVAEAKAVGGMIASGAGTDHLAAGSAVSLQEVIAAYEQQVSFVEAAGSRVILMASRALAACAKSSEDYEYVYERILSQVSQPVILHWLGDMFDPALRGYWGHGDADAAMDACLRIINAHADKIDGIKISLLDEQKEVAMRRRLPGNVKMYTGDDFNYPQLIKGDESGYSHALLGIFDAIAPAAAAALQALDEGRIADYDAILEKTVPLSRHIFQRPTYVYKTGIVFMAYLNGHQEHFRMIGGSEGARSIVHLSKLLVLADQAGLIRDAEIAAERMSLLLKLAGI